MGRCRIIRMDEWDVFSSGSRLRGKDVPLCDMVPRAVMNRYGGRYYFSFYRRTRKGIPFAEIKNSSEHARQIALTVSEFLISLVGSLDGWAIVTTPRRRHYGGFHLATEVCRLIAGRTGAVFYPDAVQCLNRCRIEPEFHLLRVIGERKVVIFDDIITTGATMKATADLFTDKETVLNLVAIKNR